MEGEWEVLDYVVEINDVSGLIYPENISIDYTQLEAQGQFVVVSSDIDNMLVENADAISRSWMEHCASLLRIATSMIASSGDSLQGLFSMSWICISIMGLAIIYLIFLAITAQDGPQCISLLRPQVRGSLIDAISTIGDCDPENCDSWEDFSTSLATPLCSLDYFLSRDEYIPESIEEISNLNERLRRALHKVTELRIDLESRDISRRSAQECSDSIELLAHIFNAKYLMNTIKICQARCRLIEKSPALEKVRLLQEIRRYISRDSPQEAWLLQSRIRRLVQLRSLLFAFEVSLEQPIVQELQSEIMGNLRQIGMRSLQGLSALPAVTNDNELVADGDDELVQVGMLTLSERREDSMVIGDQAAVMVTNSSIAWFREYEHSADVFAHNRRDEAARNYERLRMDINNEVTMLQGQCNADRTATTSLQEKLRDDWAAHCTRQDRLWGVFFYTSLFVVVTIKMMTGPSCLMDINDFYSSVRSCVENHLLVLIDAFQWSIPFSMRMWYIPFTPLLSHLQSAMGLVIGSNPIVGKVVVLSVCVYTRTLPSTFLSYVLTKMSIHSYIVSIVSTIVAGACLFTPTASLVANNLWPQVLLIAHTLCWRLIVRLQLWGACKKYFVWRSYCFWLATALIMGAVCGE